MTVIASSQVINVLLGLLHFLHSTLLITLSLSLCSSFQPVHFFLVLHGRSGLRWFSFFSFIIRDIISLPSQLFYHSIVREILTTIIISDMKKINRVRLDKVMSLMKKIDVSENILGGLGEENWGTFPVYRRK